MKLISILRIIFDPRCIKLFYDVHKFYKKDPNYSILKILKVMFNCIKGEKIVRFGNRYIISSFLPPLPSKAFLSVMHAVKEKENPYTQQMMARRSAPISCFISLTNRCNMNCIHCSNKSHPREKELSTSEWKSVINELLDMGTAIIGITGGEPLLREDLGEIVSSIDERAISILYTNGSNLTENRANLLRKCGLFAVGISLDSSNEEEHDRRRGFKGAFKNATQAIKNARKAGLYTIAQTVVFRQDLNEEKLFSLFSFAKKLGANEVRILEPIRSGNLIQYKDEIFFDENDRKKLREIQYKANIKRDLPKITTFAHTESKDQYGCGAGTQHSYIDASGNLYPCDFISISFGNVRNSSVKDLWTEMNRKIGIPGLSCMALAIFEKMKRDKTNVTLPVESKEFPKFYKILQGEI